MNDYLPDDPALQSLAARLAAAAPHVSPAECQRLLYEAGVAAGRSAMTKRLQRWKGCTAAAAMLFIASITWTSTVPRPTPLRHATNSMIALNPSPQPDSEMVLRSSWFSPPLALDAWQTSPAEDALADDLEHFAEQSPQTRSLAMSSLLTHELP